MEKLLYYVSEPFLDSEDTTDIDKNILFQLKKASEYFIEIFIRIWDSATVPIPVVLQSMFPLPWLHSATGYGGAKCLDFIHLFWEIKTVAYGTLYEANSHISGIVEFLFKQIIETTFLYSEIRYLESLSIEDFQHGMDSEYYLRHLFVSCRILFHSSSPITQYKNFQLPEAYRLTRWAKKALEFYADQMYGDMKQLLDAMPQEPQLKNIVSPSTRMVLPDFNDLLIQANGSESTRNGVSLPRVLGQD